MPCLNCNALIERGTGLSFLNGLGCSNCIPVENHTFLRENFELNSLTYIHAGYTGRRARYAVVDEITSENFPYIESAYYVVVLKQTQFNGNERNYDSIDYLVVPPDSIINNFVVANCSIIASGNITVKNCRFYSLNAIQNRAKTVTLVNSEIGYIRGWRDKVITIDLTLNNSKKPSSIYLLLNSLTYHHCDTELYLDNAITDSFTAHIVDSSIPRLHVDLSDMKKLELINTTIEMYENESEEYILEMYSSTIKAYESTSIPIPAVFIHSEIILLECVICPICKRPIIGQSTLLIKNTTVHSDCFQRDSYSFSNYPVIGETTKLPQFGFELELHYAGGLSLPTDYQELLFDLILHGFIRTGDSTVSDEMKSPILKSDKWLVECSDYLEHAAKNYVDISCGTHIHVAMERYALQFYNHRASVFEALTDYMHQHEKETLYLWGRFFGDWSKDSVAANDRYSWLNLYTGKGTLEYRLPKITSVQQYRRLIWFTRIMTAKLDSIFKDQSTKSRIYYSQVEKQIVEYYCRFAEKALRSK